MLVNLTSLDLSHNALHFIESGAFRKLEHLRTLDLSFNKMIHYTVKYFPINLFTSLAKLEELSIQGLSEDHDLHYPEAALSQLVNLKSLKIDGLNTTFGSGVRSLKHLHFVTITSSWPTKICYLKTINSTFFINLPYLKKLEISFCPISQVDPLAYKKVNLTSLSFSFLNQYDLYKAFDDLSGFQNSSLKNLTFIHLYLSAMPCRYLNSAQAKYLQNIALEVLDLSDNRLALLGEDFASSLPQTLRILILRNNRFSLYGLVITQVSHLMELTEIDISIQNQVEPYFVQEGLAARRYMETSVDARNIIHTESTKKMLHARVQRVPLNLPPNLRVLKASQYYSLGTILLHSSWNRTKLSEIDFSKGFLTQWSEGHIHETITKIDLSENYCKHINRTFFQSKNSLIYLNMHNNALGADFAEDNDGAILAELANLKYLDISYNLIYKLPSEFFKGLTALETLKLSKNELQTLNTTFSQMTRLRYLDLSRNSIVWISEKVRNDLDQIGEQLSVDLTLNPLPCTCAAIEILNWMANTKVQLQKKDFLQCRFENGEIEFIGDLEQRVSSLKRICASKALVIVICVASMVIFGD
ncbi:unnamed protein product [Lymnaea stagnalis]|uniref:Uncharacterized protein n=1 Tax=Lymnaea stagnalis TaxID=6523 RepID=A0AAV2I1Y6_LYMST